MGSRRLGERLGRVYQVSRDQLDSVQICSVSASQPSTNLQYLPAHQRYLPLSIRATATARCVRWRWACGSLFPWAS